MRVIDERQLEIKKMGEVKNDMWSEPLQEAWTTFDPMLAHRIQLLQCRLSTSFPICPKPTQEWQLLCVI
jgi:hypothetical protein